MAAINCGGGKHFSLAESQAPPASTQLLTTGERKENANSLKTSVHLQ